MRNVYLCQVNNTYGTNAFLPYSVGLLQAYALTIPIIKENYYFVEFIYLREPIEDVLKRLDNPDVFGVSCYIWNWEYSIALARAVKKAFPKCLMVLGGPHVPDRSDGFFRRYSFADILVHNEGELTFADILQERLKFHSIYTGIQGVSINADGETIKTPIRPRVTDLDTLPSPYLTGVFDEIVKHPYDLHPTQEVARGCPYMCSFCCWGSNIFAKLKKFSMERLVEEIKWFAKHRLDLLYNADANFAIFESDIELVKHMVEIKKEYGYPKKFRAAYAKNSNERVFEVAKMLNNAGMNKGVTLSFQSMDDHVLTVIKRKNIQVKDFKSLMQKYRAEKIATYSEIIVGLPEETYDTFANGLNILIECGQHESIQVYICEVLPNAEMGNPEYQKKYGIKTCKVPVLFFHGTPATDPHQEYYELIVSTNKLQPQDWLNCLKLSWAIQCFHCLTLTQCLAVFLFKYCDINYRNFYEQLLEFDNQTVVGKAVDRITKLFAGIADGKPWGIVDERFGNIIWPPEEGAFLQIVVEKNQFYEELKPWLKKFITNEALLESLIEYQKNILISPQCGDCIKFSLNYNIHEYLQAAYVDQDVPLIKKEIRYVIKNHHNYDNLEDYAKKAVWYNRKGGSMSHKEVENV